MSWFWIPTWVGVAAVVGPWVQFRDETSSRLIADLLVAVNDTDEKSYAWGDLDRDGDIDLICVRKPEWGVNGGRRDVLFMNEGIGEGHGRHGVLVDRTQPFATAATDQGMGFLDSTNDRGVAVFDMNRDGFLDVVTAVTLSDGTPKRLSHPRIYRNLGSVSGAWGGLIHDEARFPQLFFQPGNIGAAPRFGAVAWGDLNDDDFPDLYFSNDDAGSSASPDLNDRILINNMLGSFYDFHDVLVPSGVLDSFRSASVAIADMNADGLADVVKCEAGGANPGVRISYNNPNVLGALDRTELVYRGTALQLCVGDLNGDDRPDIVVADAGTDRFLIHRGVGEGGLAQFSSHLFQHDSGTDDGSAGNCVIADLNHDGRNDVLIADVDAEFPGCGRRLHLYRNLGPDEDPQFEEQGGAVPWTPRGVHDVAVFDLDGDGWNDMVIGTCIGTQVWINVPPAAITFRYPDGLPSRVRSRQATPFRIELTVVDEPLVPIASAALHVSVDDGPFTIEALSPLGEYLYQAELPPIGCVTTIRWFASVRMADGSEWTDPPGAPPSNYRTLAAVETAIAFRDEFERDIDDWSVHSIDLEFGAWERSVSTGTSFAGRQAAPAVDATRGPSANKAFVTQNGVPGADPSRRDVDGGPTFLISPRFDLEGRDAIISYSQWLFCEDRNTPDRDYLTVEVSGDDGETWTPVSSSPDTDSEWETGFFRVGDSISPSALVRVRFGVADPLNNSITEAAIDDFQVQSWDCEARSIAIVASNPPNDAIDARQPHDLDSTSAVGWDSVDLTFNRPIVKPAPTDFAVSMYGSDGTPPEVVFVIQTGPQTLKLLLSGTVLAGAWTEIQYIPIKSRVRLGSLPGDVNGDRISNPQDIDALVGILGEQAPGRPLSSTDCDRSGVITPADVLRAVELLIGSDTFSPWTGRELP